MTPPERVLYFVLGLLLAVAGCSSDQTCSSAPPGGSEDQEYQLVARLWRDFMPISPPDGKPLVASVRVVEQHGEAIPPELELTHLWVINQDQVWATTLSPDGLPHEEHELCGIATDGPKWGPDITVHVLVEIDKGDGTSEVLLAADQLIARVD